MILKVNDVIKGQFYKLIIGKWTISWSFSYYSFVEFHGKRIGSHNMTMLYPKFML